MSRRNLLLLAAILATGGAAEAQTRPSPALTLREAIERALAQSPEVAGARAEAQSAAVAARSAESAFAPQAFATTTPGYSSGLPVAVAGRVPSVFGIELHKTLYDPIRRAEALESDARAIAAESAAARAETEAVRAAILAYARVRADQVLVESARRTLESREAIFRRATALAREGRRTELDVDKGGLDVARAKQALLDRESEQDLDRLELARLVGWSAGEPVTAADDPAAALPAAGGGDDLARARSADRELAAIDRELETLERAAVYQKRGWLPVVQAEGQYLRLSNYNNFDQYFVKFKSNDWALGVSVAIPLWTGGRLGLGQAAANARLDKARADRRARERDLELAVRRAQSESVRADSRRKLALRATAVSEESMRVARALAAEGRIEPDELDRREVEATAARDELAHADSDLAAARVKLLELRGELPGAGLVAVGLVSR